MADTLISKKDIFGVLTSNGWIWMRYDGWNERDTFCFKATFTDVYAYEVLACVSCNKNHIGLNGHLGVLWLEVMIIDAPDCTFDKYYGASFNDLEVMRNCLLMAEENLIRCGVPFSKDYKFHGKNRANMTRRNIAIRKRMNLDSVEEHLMLLT